MNQNYAAVIGNFDGIHMGHQYILNKLKDTARRHSLKTMAITFDTHPRQVFDHTFKPSFLTTLDERISLLKRFVDEVKVFHFDENFASVSAHDFMEHQLRDELGVRLLLLGYDNRFGKRTPTENFNSYMDYGSELGIEIILANPVDVCGMRVSSSQVRHAVVSGRMEEVTETLGRPYSISGIVVQGHHEGHKLGFPTANILPPAGKILPPNGVYATRVVIEDSNPLTGGLGWVSMTNIGSRPTFNNGKEVTIESNIFDFNENIYGKTITVSFLHFIRPEQKFGSVEALKEQMELDRKQAK